MLKTYSLSQRLVHLTASILLTANGPLGAHIQCLRFIQASKTSYSLT
ncbi:unnamed protein product, partial [Onchocerca ochengi]|uniref:Uncharacterized protein n=1 Tax=Onchocerca ochengi TaxID=42157 RepID=A0A182DY53_ONCOC